MACQPNFSKIPTTIRNQTVSVVRTYFLCRLQRFLDCWRNTFGPRITSHQDSAREYRSERQTRDVVDRRQSAKGKEKECTRPPDSQLNSRFKCALSDKVVATLSSWSEDILASLSNVKVEKIYSINLFRIVARRTNRRSHVKCGMR